MRKETCGINLLLETKVRAHRHTRAQVKWSPTYPFIEILVYFYDGALVRLAECYSLNSCLLKRWETVLSIQQVALNEDLPPMRKHAHTEAGDPCFPLQHVASRNGADGRAAGSSAQGRGYLPKQSHEDWREETNVASVSPENSFTSCPWTLHSQFLCFFIHLSREKHVPPPTAAAAAGRAALITNVFQTCIASSWEKLHLFSLSRWKGEKTKRLRIRSEQD